MPFQEYEKLQTKILQMIEEIDIESTRANQYLEVIIIIVFCKLYHNKYSYAFHIKLIFLN